MKYNQILHLQSALLPDQSLSFAIDYTEFDMKAIYDLSKSKEKDAVLSQDEQHRLAQVYNILHGDIAISFYHFKLRSTKRCPTVVIPLKALKMEMWSLHSGQLLS